MMLHGGGVIYGWQPARRILELIYPSTDPPAFESRDLAWAWAFLIVGAWLILLTLTRLVGRRPAVRADAGGLILSVGSPLRRPVSLAWDQVGSVAAGTASDDYSTYPTLLVELDDPSLFGFRLWGAAWREDGALSIAAGDWVTDAPEVAERVAELRMSPDPVAASAGEELVAPSGEAEGMPAAAGPEGGAG